MDRDADETCVLPRTIQFACRHVPPESTHQTATHGRQIWKDPHQKVSI